MLSCGLENDDLLSYISPAYTTLKSIKATRDLTTPAWWTLLSGKKHRPGCVAKKKVKNIQNEVTQVGALVIMTCLHKEWCNNKSYTHLMGGEKTQRKTWEFPFVTGTVVVVTMNNNLKRQIRENEPGCFSSRVDDGVLDSYLFECVSLVRQKCKVHRVSCNKREGQCTQGVSVSFSKFFSYEMRSHQLIPVDRGLEDFLLKPDLVVALELVRQLHRVTQHAGQPVVDRFVFRILLAKYKKIMNILCPAHISNENYFLAFN